MARLDPSRMKRRVEQSLTKDKVLKRKVEKQKQKEIYSEKWYQDEMERRSKELEEISSNENEFDKISIRDKKLLPTFFDCFDINTLFNPVHLIRNQDEKTIKIRFDKYKANEKLFEPGLISLDEEFNRQDELIDFYSKVFNDDEDYQKLMDRRKEVSEKLKQKRKERIDNEEVKKKFNLDLSEIEDTKSEEELQKLIEEYENLGITEEDLLLLTDDDVPTIKNSEVWEKLGEFRTNFFRKVSDFFHRTIPVYDKYMCTCCGKAKTLDEYYVYYSLTNISRTDYHGNVRMSICKDCAQKLFNYFYLEESNKSIEVALKKWCASLNIYYEDKIAIQALRNYSVKEHENDFIKEYLNLIYLNEENIEKNFLDSPFLFQAFDKGNNFNLDEESLDKIAEENEPFIWKKEDIRNKKQVIRMIGYDPFGYETDENKVILYSDLLNMLEAGMENDMVKVQAAIQIVLGYFKIRGLNEQEFQMRKDKNVSLADLKSLGAIKTAELNAISKFCQDNGFSERFATAKAKGENTFTGILSKMNEDKYENALINRYDIETSTTIQQAADASVAAIFRQLNMSETDAWKTCQDQLAELLKLRKENAMFAEQLRKIKYELKKADLIKEAKEQGIDIDEVDSFSEMEEDEDD